MSQTPAQLQQEFQNELNTTNQLLRLISVELQQITHLTNPGGDFESNIIKNASLIKQLAKLQKLDIDKIAPFTRNQIDVVMDVSQNACEEPHTLRHDSEMEESS